MQSAAAKYSLPPALLLAIISIESRFKEKAKGPRGATGPMQVVPAAHRGLLRNVKDLTEPTANIGWLGHPGRCINRPAAIYLALKSYGGSMAYAQKVSMRVGTFAPVVADQRGGARSASDDAACAAPPPIAPRPLVVVPARSSFRLEARRRARPRSACRPLPRAGDPYRSVARTRR